MGEREGAKKVISFSGSKHGVNSFAWTDAGLKALGWPQVPYPVDDSSEEFSLEELESALSSGGVAAVVLEPMNTSSGHSCSPDFASEVSTLARQSDAAFIVDEANTGCGATGSYWGSDKWGLESGIDYLAFGNRTQIAGFYSSKDIARHSALHAHGCDPLKLQYL